MNRFSYRPYYERNLPHFQPAGATLFVTFRLAGSLPVRVIQELLAQSEQWTLKAQAAADSKSREMIALQAQRALFAHWDQAHDLARTGSRWLAMPEIATLVADALHHLDGQSYELLGFCVMPNHVHSVLTPLNGGDGEPQSMSAVLHSLKSFTAHEANRQLHRQGEFWQHESYDHWVRTAKECRRTLNYVCANPVKAGLVEDWHDWQWTYVRELE